MELKRRRVSRPPRAKATCEKIPQWGSPLKGLFDSSHLSTFALGRPSFHPSLEAEISRGGHENMCWKGWTGGVATFQETSPEGCSSDELADVGKRFGATNYRLGMLLTPHPSLGKINRISPSPLLCCPATALPTTYKNNDRFHDGSARDLSPSGRPQSRHSRGGTRCPRTQSLSRNCTKAAGAQMVKAWHLHHNLRTSTSMRIDKYMTYVSPYTHTHTHT